MAWVAVWPEAMQPWCLRVYSRITGDLPGGPSRTAAPSDSVPAVSSCQPPASTGDPPTLAGGFGSLSCGVTAPLLWVLVYVRFCLCPPRLESLFPPSPVKVLLSNPTGLQGQIPWGFLIPLSDLQAGNPDVGFRTFTTVGELVWYYCSPVYGRPPGEYGI